MEQVLRGDPKTILNRGYALIRNRQNKVLTSKAAAQQEDFLVIEFKDGRLSCQMEEK
jgi:exonuclease VII large subunit